VSAQIVKRLIDPDRYRKAVVDLASPEMEGRQVGTPGGWTAIRYVTTRFQEAGLEPGYKGSFLQPYRHCFKGTAGAANVIGVIEGRDPETKHQVVVVSAHRDHLGRTKKGGCPNNKAGKKIKPGANDNASGTAALFELAHAFGEVQAELKRTLVFLSTDAEECGCTGIKHYVYRDPAFPLENTVYNLNIDQIGEGAKLETHKLNRRDLRDDEECDVDAEVFATRGVRAETLVGGNRHYHKASDTPENIDFEAALKAVRRATKLVWRAVQDPEYLNG
jgi:Zn-dependent M28 family amino/carboxypeptidase